MFALSLHPLYWYVVNIFIKMTAFLKLKFI
jgi:hypothetical protein